eukprot:TRINITY_DN527_c0_g1_i11.p1 TRINITY_DN527_c0_g1~~TRINITY_DN527_c0_g1_i11.p1  ORF type:complete len:131 (+),score=10.65 TRINITY_DN527_c0_g1_i11:61-453(+)
MNRLAFTIVALALFAIVSCEVEENFAERECCCQRSGSTCIKTGRTNYAGRCSCSGLLLAERSCCCQRNGSQCIKTGRTNFAGHCACSGFLLAEQHLTCCCERSGFICHRHGRPDAAGRCVCPPKPRGRFI